MPYINKPEYNTDFYNFGFTISFLYFTFNKRYIYKIILAIIKTYVNNTYVIFILNWFYHFRVETNFQNDIDKLNSFNKSIKITKDNDITDFKKIYKIVFDRDYHLNEVELRQPYIYVLVIQKCTFHIFPLIPILHTDRMFDTVPRFSHWPPWIGLGQVQQTGQAILWIGCASLRPRTG